MFRRKEPPIEERNVRLMHHLEFSESDLVTNRHGKLSEGQYRYFERVAKNMSPLWMLLAPIILVATGVLIAFQLNNRGFFETVGRDEMLIIAVGLGGGFLLYTMFLTYAMYRAWKMRDLSPDQYEVRSISGKVRHINTDSTFPIIRVGRHRVYSYSKGADEAFVKGQHYTVYCIKAHVNMNYLLTAEAE